MIPITRSHNSSAFTPAELKSLIDDERVYFFDPFVPTDGYPYVVLVEKTPADYFASDAWFINEAGQKQSGNIYPQPVKMSEISDIGFADPQLRQPLINFAEHKLYTWIFGMPTGQEVPGSLQTQFMGKSLGVGANELAARHDAMARLKVRVPGLSDYSDSDFAGAKTAKERYGCLYAALKEGSASVLSQEPGSYPKQRQLGHDYMNHETAQAAAVFSSDTEVCEAMQSAQSSAAVLWKTCLAKARDTKCISNKGDVAQIDWAEVLDDVLDQQMGKELQADGPQPFAPAIIIPDSVVKPKGRAIADDVLEILAACRTENVLVYLPPTRIDPKLYKRVDEVLFALGGKWVGGKVQAHRFKEDPSGVLAVAVQTGSFMKPQDFGFFPTPANLVERVLRMARIELGMRVFEPNGGTGAFAVPMAAMAGGLDRVKVCELLPANVKKLRDLGFTDIHHGDFLEMTPEPVFDFIAMNPPFSGGADIAHVMHAAKFLRPDGQLLAITSPTWTSIQNKKSSEFRDFVGYVDAEMQTVERGAFSESGTQIETRILKFEARNFPWHREKICQKIDLKPSSTPAQVIATNHQHSSAAEPTQVPLLAHTERISRSIRFAHKRTAQAVSLSSTDEDQKNRSALSERG